MVETDECFYSSGLFASREKFVLPPVFQLPALGYIHMQAPNIVDFAVATSIGVMFFQGTNTDSRVRQFEQIAETCIRLLQHLGRPPYLKSIFDLWVTTTAALAQLERMLFPTEPVQTPTHLTSPPGWRPLSAVCEPTFRVHHATLRTGRVNLQQFRAWFCDQYDIYLHHETLNMIDDALLLMESAEHFLQLNTVPTPDDPVDIPDSTGGDTTTPARAPALRHRQVPPPDPWRGES